MSRYIDHYEGQVGGGIDRVFVGAPYQRGHGLGSFLSGLFRRALPLLTRGARAVGKEALSTGLNILGDVAHNTPFKDAFKNRITESGRNLKRKAEETFENLMQGSGYKIHDRSMHHHSLFGHPSSHIGTSPLKALKYTEIRKTKKSTKKRRKALSTKRSKKKSRKSKKKSRGQTKNRRIAKRKKRTVADIFG